MDQPEHPAPAVDWHALARQLGSLRDDGEMGGSDLGRRALELIVGDDALRAAVDFYVEGLPGSELARSVLALLRPRAAMQRCLEVVRSEAEADARQRAAELLRVVCDARGLAWVPEFLHDPNEGVQVWGAGIVDQLLFSGQVEPRQCGPVLLEMERHPNAGVRRYAELVRSYLAARRDPNEQDATDKGLVHVASPHPVAEALCRIEALALARGLTIFARIDFSGDAERVGLHMRPTQLLLLGNPRSGTPLMVAAPSVAIDLPLKVLAWQDNSGQAWLSYNAPEYLQSRHGFPAELLGNLAGLSGLVEAALASTV